VTFGPSCGGSFLRYSETKFAYDLSSASRVGSHSHRTRWSQHKNFLRRVFSDSGCSNLQLSNDTSHLTQIQSGVELWHFEIPPIFQAELSLGTLSLSLGLSLSLSLSLGLSLSIGISLTLGTLAHVPAPSLLFCCFSTMDIFPIC